MRPPPTVRRRTEYDLHIKLVLQIQFAISWSFSEIKRYCMRVTRVDNRKYPLGKRLPQRRFFSLNIWAAAANFLSYIPTPVIPVSISAGTLLFPVWRYRACNSRSCWGFLNAFFLSVHPAFGYYCIIHENMQIHVEQ